MIKVELKGLAAVEEREMVFALSGAVLVAGGLVPGTRRLVELIVAGAPRRLKLGAVRSTNNAGSTISEVLGRHAKCEGIVW